MTCSRVFVYGTLKSGYGNNRLLETAKKIGEFITTKSFVMQNCGFPYAIDTDFSDCGFVPKPIRGEVWEVDDEVFQNLDWLEGYPNHYNRQQVQIEGEDSSAWMYYVDDFQDLEICPIVDGCYQWG